ncbi:hypothetical protein [Halomicrococcus sp. SG-WS-1]|uniref:hypothetical protein n=1 Tax=Halomicrococcus sp. SG-WS-1 TaxID=3439057 RepID=UPI003F7AF99C
MTQKERESQYEKKYRSTNQTAPSAGDLVIVESDKQAQLGRLRITAGESNTFTVEVRDHDGSNAQTVASFVGSDVDEGSFEEPVHEAGATKEYAIKISNAGSSSTNYAVNVRVDERTG